MTRRVLEKLCLEKVYVSEVPKCGRSKRGQVCEKEHKSQNGLV